MRRPGVGAGRPGPAQPGAGRVLPGRAGARPARGAHGGAGARRGRPRRDRCAGARDYALLVADVRYLDPETYIGFGDGAHNYTLFLQVGGYAEAAAVRRDRRLPDTRYNAWLSEIYAEGDADRPFEPFVVGEAARLVGGLATFWWEDNPRRNPRAALLPPLSGGALALLVGGGVWWAWHRRVGGRGVHRPNG